MVRILLCRVNSSRSDVDARKEPSSDNLIPCSWLPGTMADHYHEMMWSKPRCARPLLLLLLLVLLLMVGPRAINSVTATIVCMKLFAIRRQLMSRKFCGRCWESHQCNHSQWSHLAVVYLWKSNHNAFVTLVVVRANIQGFRYSVSLEQQPQNFRDISRRPFPVKSSCPRFGTATAKLSWH